MGVLKDIECQSVSGTRPIQEFHFGSSLVIEELTYLTHHCTILLSSQVY